MKLYDGGRAPNPRRTRIFLAEKGITTVEDAGSPLATIDRMKQMVDEGKMGVRLWVMVRQDNAVI